MLSRKCELISSTQGIQKLHQVLNLSFYLTTACTACVQLRKDTYTRLSPVQRLQVARHPNRPTFLDIALNISDKFVELHGDRAGLDDPAMVCGLASIDGVSFVFVGQQKGRNTKVSEQQAFDAARTLLRKCSVRPNTICCNFDSAKALCRHTEHAFAYVLLCP